MICYNADVKQFIESSICVTCRDGEADWLVRTFDYYFGAHPKVEKFPIHKELGMGADVTLTWRNIVLRAKSEGRPYITLFEPDAYPRRDAADVLPRLLERIPDDAHFIFWGTIRGIGCDENMFGKEELRPFRGSLPGCHAVTILEKGYDDVIDLYETGSKGIDHGMSGKPGAYYCIPLLFVQCNYRRSHHGMLGYNGHPFPHNGFDNIPELFIGNSLCITIKDGEADELNRYFDSVFGVHPITQKYPVRNDWTCDRNIMESWINVVRYAQTHKWPYVVAFESDAYPRSDALAQLASALRTMPKDMDICFLNPTWHNPPTDSMSDAKWKLLTEDLGGTGGMVISARAYDAVLNLPSNAKHVDVGFSRLRTNLKVYTLEPQLFIQFNRMPSSHRYYGYVYNARSGGIHDYDRPQLGFPYYGDALYGRKTIQLEISEFISSAFCITCREHEGDRLAWLFDKVFGVHPHIRHYPIREGLSANDNLRLNWISLIEESRARGDKFITVFESDAYPCVDAVSKLRDSIACVPQCAHVVFWGYNSYRREGPYASPMFRTAGNIYGSHAVTVFEDAYDAVIEHLRNKGELVDHALYACNNVFFVPDNIFTQYNLFSSSISGHSGYGGKNKVPDGFLQAEQMFDSVLIRNMYSNGPLSVLYIGHDSKRMTEIATCDNVGMVYCVDRLRDEFTINHGVSDKVRLIQGDIFECRHRLRESHIDVVYVDVDYAYRELRFVVMASFAYRPAYIAGSNYGSGDTIRVLNETIGRPDCVLPDGTWCKKWSKA